MNGSFYQNPKFPTIDENEMNNSFEQGYEAGQLQDLPMQQSYINNE